MLKLPAIFGNGAVLQREKPVFVWGETDADLVWILLKDEKGRVCEELEIAVCDGSFIGTLEARKAGGPYHLFFGAGRDQIELTDLYFGEVWLAGGQSNMELELQNSKDGEREVFAAQDPLVRFYYTPKVAWIGEELLEAEKASSWQKCEAETVRAWSAIGYYFARRLAQKLGVMVGIIGCNWGGTSATCWMSRERLSSHPAMKAYLDEYEEACKGRTEEEYLRDLAEYEVYQAEFDRKVGEYYQTAENPTWDEAIALFGENRYPGPVGDRSFTRPAGLYESMLSRIAPYSLRGFLYYQGEEDDNRPYDYGTLLQNLICQWREEDWMDPEATFLVVQLPIFLNENEIDDDNCNWPFVREAQDETSRMLDHVGLAVILDLGEFHNIHPLDKKTVGERLALLAMQYSYELCGSMEAQGPSLEMHRVVDGTIQITLKNAFGGLDVLPREEAPGYRKRPIWDFGFELAGSDGKYSAAKIKEDLSSIVADEAGRICFTLYADDIREPLYARYFWTNFDQVRIFGKNHIPLAPFRTDKADGAKAKASRQGEIIERA